MNEFLSVDRSTVRTALANLTPSGIGSGWLGVFDPTELPKPPTPTGDPANPRCWLTYAIYQWTPRGTFAMDSTIGPARSFELHLVAWCEPVGGIDTRDATLATALDALRTYDTDTATNHMFVTQGARPLSIDEMDGSFTFGVTIVPSWGGVSR